MASTESNFRRWLIFLARRNRLTRKTWQGQQRILRLRAKNIKIRFHKEVWKLLWLTCLKIHRFPVIIKRVYLSNIHNILQKRSEGKHVVVFHVDFFKFRYASTILSDKHIEVPEILSKFLTPGGKNPRKWMSHVDHAHFDVVDCFLKNKIKTWSALTHERKVDLFLEPKDLKLFNLV